ncbi:MAG: cupin [Blastocatellia bacterium]|nr:cupin [Blastocatellia bacterium]
MRCQSFSQTLDTFTRRLGFRIEMILPADAPQAAVISAHGVTIRLENETEAALIPASMIPRPDSLQTLLVSRHVPDRQWNEGRAGMRYRDLIPGRLGGYIIASQIRIPQGGKTPDYVHYHKVLFQMIYCKEGWARLVYEDQGPPFLLQAGDCVLQPPEIRHRVLETSAGLEVIEIACPAIHETHADHELELPTPQILPERLFHNQRFVLHKAGEASWAPCLLDGFEARDTGIAAATDGMAAARVIRSSLHKNETTIQHSGNFLFLYVLKGELSLDNPEDSAQLHEGDNCVIPAGRRYLLQASSGLEMLEVRLPVV